ncbi:MAG: DNA replication and repair protein RecF [bacterium]
MRIHNLKLINFRNFKNIEFDFDEGVNLITAQNGMGKTNILESIRILSYGKPLFSNKEAEVINFEVLKSSLPFTKIIMKWNNEEDHSSTYTLSPNIKPVKSLVIDDQKKIQKHFVGKFSTVWFSPETINVITASPRHRRELLNAYFCQISYEYSVALSDYQKALEARNRLLKNADRNGINFYIKRYDEVLIKYGVELINVKKALCEKFSAFVSNASEKQSRYKVIWKFEPDVELSDIFDQNIALAFRECLKANLEKDIRSKRTGVGPHKDNWTLLLTDLVNKSEAYDLRFFGSRGQKRMGLLIFTLAVVAMIEVEKGSKPVLLLDDVVSELDEENVDLIIDMLLEKGQQSIITSTHDKIDGLNKVKVVYL